MVGYLNFQPKTISKYQTEIKKFDLFLSEEDTKDSEEIEEEEIEKTSKSSECSEIRGGQRFAMSRDFWYRKLNTLKARKLDEAAVSW